MFTRKLTTAISHISSRSAKAIPAQRSRLSTDSFVIGLYTNQLATKHVLPYPSVLDEERSSNLSQIVDATDAFMKSENNADENDKNCQIGKAWEGAKDLGAFGLLVPEEYSGMGCNNTEFARLTEIMLGEDAGFSIAIGAHQSIGYKAILLLGTDAQKEKYLPKLAMGEWIAAFALTEPSTGSDASSVQTKCELSADGKHYIMNGSKIWISNGGIADVFTVFAKVVHKQPNGTTIEKMSAFIVERSFGGVTNGPPENKMGIKSSNTAEVFFEDVKIPVENLILNEGDGFKTAMEVLNNGRFGMAAGLCGSMKKCMATAVDFASTRKQFFNTEIHHYGAIQEKIARMSMLHYAAESMAYILCASMDNNAESYQLEAACCKIFSSEAAWWVCDEAIQVCGGMGYMRDTGLERVMRDLRIFRIFEGTNDILRLFIALTGFKHLGGTLDDIKGLPKGLSTMNFDAISTGLGWLRKHEGGKMFGGQKMAASLAVEGELHPSLAWSAEKVDKSIADFQFTATDLTMKYQKKLMAPENQMMIRKIADSTIAIYSMAAVLSRSSRALMRGDSSAEHEKLMTEAWIKDQTSQVKLWLKEARSNAAFHSDLTQISKNVIKAGGVIQPHPLGV